MRAVLRGGEEVFAAGNGIVQVRRMLDGENIFERRPKLTARTSFPCGQLDENGCLQGKGARTESSTGCMLKVSFCGLCYVPVFRRKLRQTKKIISLTYDNQQINRRAARYVVFIRENSRIPPFISTQEVSSIEPAARIKSFFISIGAKNFIAFPFWRT